MRRLLLAAIALSVPAAVSAGELVVTVDPASTETTFTVAATLHKVDGSVPLTAGEIRFDPATGVASGRIVFNATRATTDNEGRDRKMHEEVLESAKYPEFVFVPAKVEGLFNNTGVSKLSLAGTLTIHGADHPLTIPLEVTAAPDTLRARGRFTIPYVAWGMKDPSVFLLRVAKEVDVAVDAQGSVKPAS